MERLDPQKKKLADYIYDHLPTEADFTWTTESKAPTLTIPNQLNNQKEEQLLDKAFHYLFALNVARETRAPFEANDLFAINGHLLVKRHHPYNLAYDFKFVVAKTRLEGYVHKEPYTVPYNREAAHIFGACYLFAQLDLIAQSGDVPENMGRDFYFMPKGRFMEEFETMNELALSDFISPLSAQDDARIASEILLNKQRIHTTLSESMENGIDPVELTQIVFEYLDQKANERFGVAPPLHSFHEVGLYFARFGEMKTLDLDAYYGEQLPIMVETFHALML